MARTQTAPLPAASNGPRHWADPQPAAGRARRASLVPRQLHTTPSAVSLNHTEPHRTLSANA